MPNDSKVQVLNDQMITNMLSVLMFQRDLNHWLWMHNLYEADIRPLGANELRQCYECSKDLDITVANF